MRKLNVNYVSVSSWLISLLSIPFSWQQEYSYLVCGIQKLVSNNCHFSFGLLSISICQAGKIYFMDFMRNRGTGCSNCLADWPESK